MTFAFQINGGLVGSSNVRSIETDAYSSGPISIPRAGIIEASELLPLIMQHYNAKLNEAVDSDSFYSAKTIKN